MIAGEQLVLHQGLIVLFIFDRKIAKERGDGVSITQSDGSRTLLHAFCGWCLDVIRDVIDESAEFALVNAFNSHALGIEINPAAVEEYKEYLQFRADVDKMVESILEETD